MAFRALMAALLALVASAFHPSGAWATGCFPVADGGARLVRVALPAGTSARLTFLGHASFLIETAGGVSAVTDYNGYVRPPETPDLVTMNNAHSTHYTVSPDPGIAHVLRGWNPEGGEARHDVTVGDLRARNVPTSVHGRSGAQGNSNSIFVFELADLCIAHLGHLHHRLTEQHLAELGQIDVLLVPIDGAYTMSQGEMLEVIEAVAPSVVVPMHYFGEATLGRFLALLDERWDVVRQESPSVLLARATLPYRQVLVLPGF